MSGEQRPADIIPTLPESLTPPMEALIPPSPLAQPDIETTTPPQGDNNQENT